MLISGAVGYGGSVLLQNIGVQRTSVTHAALLIGATPVLVAIMAALLRHSVAPPVAWLGFALSLAGVTVIAGRQGSGSTLGGDGLVLAAQLVSAAFTVSQARLLRGRDPIAVTTLQLSAAAVAVLPVALMTEAMPGSPAGSATLLAVIALVLAGTVLPTTLFTIAQARVSADVAGAFVNLEPLVGAAAGTMLFGDPLGQVQLAGGAAIVAGITLSSLQAIRARGSRQAGTTLATAAAPATAMAPTPTPARPLLAPAPAGPERAESAAAIAAKAESWPLHEKAGLARRNRLSHVTPADAARQRLDRLRPASRGARAFRPARRRPRDPRPSGGANRP